jgi:hypothetical protein
MELELNNSERVNALIKLSNHAYDETKRYRDHVWQVLIWTISLLLSVVEATTTTPDLAKTSGGKWIGAIFIFIVAIFGAWNIQFYYTQFVFNRNLLRASERRLKINDTGVYGDGSLLPEAWKTKEYQFKEYLPYYVQWMFTIAAVSMYSLYVLISKT